MGDATVEIGPGGEPDHIITMYEAELARLDELGRPALVKEYGAAKVDEGRDTLKRLIAERKREIGIGNR